MRLEVKTKRTNRPRLGWTKYGVLAAVILAGSFGGAALFCNLDPFGFLFNLGGTLLAGIILVAILTWSVFSPRPWCRYICPYGAALGIVRAGRFYLAKALGKTLSPHILADLCNACQRCQRKCPMEAINHCQIDQFACIDCGECQRCCTKSAVD